MSKELTGAQLAEWLESLHGSEGNFGEVQERLIELDEWRALRDPSVLHQNLLRGIPAKLSLQELRHLIGEVSAGDAVDLANIRSMVATLESGEWGEMLICDGGLAERLEHQVTKLVGEAAQLDESHKTIGNLRAQLDDALVLIEVLAKYRDKSSLLTADEALALSRAAGRTAGRVSEIMNDALRGVECART